eukprot:scaffold244_cov172-Amphora_coffeaeformis.AAC.2
MEIISRSRCIANALEASLNILMSTSTRSSKESTRSKAEIRLSNNLKDCLTIQPGMERTSSTTPYHRAAIFAVQRRGLMKRPRTCERCCLPRCP